VELTSGQLDSLRRRFPQGHVQNASAFEYQGRTDVLAVVWPKVPTAERGCPTDPVKWNAYVEQSCTGFAGNLSGDAYVAWFKPGDAVEYLGLATFFSHDANPSSASSNQPRLAFVPTDFAFHFLDVDGDGQRTEFLLHIGNGPYAMLEYWVAIGVIGGTLAAVKSACAPIAGKSCGARTISASREAWIALAKTGRGQSELYCGARCADTATRWVLQRSSQGVIESEFWTCNPGDEASWKPGPASIDSCTK
jgi:hypothetical protein